MKVDVLIIRLIFLAIPGIITMYVYEELTKEKDKTTWRNFFSISLFSIFSYLIYTLFDKNSTVLKAIFDSNLSLPWNEIFISILISIGLGLIISYFHRFKIINRFGKIIYATKKFGDNDVWEYLYNSPNVEWVFIRDHKLDLIYYGWIAAFSEAKEERELLLRDVDVYENIHGKLLYKTDAMYISRNKFDLTVEIPDFNKAKRRKK